MKSGESGHSKCPLLCPEHHQDCLNFCQSQRWQSPPQHRRLVKPFIQPPATSGPLFPIRLGEHPHARQTKPRQTRPWECWRGSTKLQAQHQTIPNHGQCHDGEVGRSKVMKTSPTQYSSCRKLSIQVQRQLNIQGSSCLKCYWFS